ncbi:MAG: metallophosphoesterase [Deltaproteobacteria bacterium]|nr:metallophosphoesterase [Candidatus Zymogenaceae bacterium]
MRNGEIVLAADIHGAYEDLARALHPDDTLIIAGDTLTFMDFEDFSKAILSAAFTPEELAAGIKEMVTGNLDLIREAFREITTPGEEKYQRMLPRITAEYEALAAILPEENYIIYGNDDYPAVMKEMLDGAGRIVESGVVRLSGRTIGMVSGLPSGPRTIGFPGEITQDEYKRRIESLGPVDVIVTHVPPVDDDLTFDVIPKRNESSSTALLEYILTHRPSYAFFGHVHNPRIQQKRIGDTEAINLGFFKKRKIVTRLHLETMSIREVEI